MLEQSLNGPWEFKDLTLSDSEWLKGNVPGSVLSDLLGLGSIEEPFYRDNEDQATKLSDANYAYRKTFELDSELLKQDQIFLLCEGLDTLAEVTFNGQFIAKTNNMHRTYEFDVKPFLIAGLNQIQIVFSSPSKYIQDQQSGNPLWNPKESMKGIGHIRKAHYMFGWDWGPTLPDAGIWRSISLKSYNVSRLKEVYIAQDHMTNEVRLDINIKQEKWEKEETGIEVFVTCPNGNRISQKKLIMDHECKIEVLIHDPKIWWPNGFGAQPLYQVDVELKKGVMLLDRKTLNIGLRTLNVNRDKDEWGEAFAVEVNHKAIFGMGANYIPMDNILSRCSPEKLERLIQDCVSANFNMIRVWGGAYYPEDYFYDLCDKYGLIVWQDFMFACAVYDMNDEFSENIQKEVEDNIRRLRHHASLGILCGNNEMEFGWAEWNFPKSPKLRTDYIKQFEILLPEVSKECAASTFFWPASPSSGGSFDQPNDENRGDAHYWEVWHGTSKFTDYRKHYFRFCSEFGFQSFPSLKTVEAYTLPEDRNIFSYVMERHQKNNAGNSIILAHIADNFLYPKDLDALLYTSQLLQAESIKYGVEHWRRHRGRCMGAIYWQLNDCWPVASWASIDYYGRWKALHYLAKRFFAPYLLSAVDEGCGIELHVANETLNSAQLTIQWRLVISNGIVVKQDEFELDVEHLSTMKAIELDFSPELQTTAARRMIYLEYTLLKEGRTISSSTVLFVKPKHFQFIDPKIKANIREENDRFEIELHGQAFAKYVELELSDSEGKLDDNYFDLSADQVKTVILRKDSLSLPLSLNDVKRQLKIRSLYDTVEH